MIQCSHQVQNLLITTLILCTLAPFCDFSALKKEEWTYNLSNTGYI